MNRARILLVTGAALVLAVLAILGAVLGPASAPTSASSGASGPDGGPVPGSVAAGGVVCPLGDAVEGAVVDLVLATPAPSEALPSDGGAAVTGTPPDARATVVVLGEWPARIPPAPIAPGDLAAVTPEVAAGGMTWVGWADAPVVTWREWRRPTAPGRPAGRVGGACVPADAEVWHVVGMRTDGGSEAVLRLANPFPIDATVAVTLVTGDGGVAPIALQNLSVPAGGTADLRINDHAPELADVAAVVRVTSGRAAVEGLQSALAGVGGIDGMTLVPAATAPSRTWTLPWLPGDVDAAVVVLNPSAREVELELTVHGAEGPGLPPGIESVTVPAGGLLRIPVTDLVAPGTLAAGLTLRSATDPVVVAGSLRIAPGDAAATGIATLPALPEGDTGWLLAGVAAGEDRTETLRLVNLDAADATVTVVVRTPGGGVRALPPLVMPPGARRDVGLPVPPDGAWSVEVTADGRVVAARTGIGASVPDPVAAAGVPSTAWRNPELGLAGARREAWSLRIPPA